LTLCYFSNTIEIDEYSIAGEPWFPAGLSVRAIMNTARQKRKAAGVITATFVIVGSQ